MSKTILVADDSKTIQHVVQLTFQTTGFKVVPVANAEEALAQVKRERPDVVLADVTMPGTDGYQFCDALKRNSETSAIPVLLLAGAFEPFDERRAQAARADGHVRKPFDTQALIDRVKALTGLPVEAPAPMSFAAALQAKQDKPAAPAPSAFAAPPAPVRAAPQVSDLAPPPAPRASPLASPSPFSAPRAEVPPVREPAPPAPVMRAAPVAHAPVREEPAELDGDEFSFAGDGGSLPAGPTLEPPPPPQAEEPAPNVDVWALADSPAGEPAHGEQISARSWEAEDSSGGVEAIEEIEMDDAPAPAPAPMRAPPAPAAPAMAARGERVEVPATSFKVESSWSEPTSQAWSEESATAEIETEPSDAETQQEAWGNAGAPVEDQAWAEEQSQAETHAKSWDGGPPRRNESIAEAVVRTAEQVADRAHAEVSGLPREEMVVMAREIIERIAWEVVPELAETIIQEEIRRLLKR